MKTRSIAILLLASLSFGEASDGEAPLFFHGDMEQVEPGSTGSPWGWRPVNPDLVQLEADPVEKNTGERSLKVHSPVGASCVVTSKMIPVQSGRHYELKASVLSRGKNALARPFCGIRLIGNEGAAYPPEAADPYLVKWMPHDEEIAFVTKSATFVTQPDAKWVRIYIVVREIPPGTVNIDDISLRLVD